MSNDMIRNVEAEQSVLGSIIQEGDLIKDCQLKGKTIFFTNASNDF